MDLCRPGKRPDIQIACDLACKCRFFPEPKPPPAVGSGKQISLERKPLVLAIPIWQTATAACLFGAGRRRAADLLSAAVSQSARPTEPGGQL